MLLSHDVVIPTATPSTCARLQQLAGNSKITRYVPRIANDVSPNLAKRIETETRRCAAVENAREDGWSVRYSGEIGDMGQPLIHRHIERTIKLETRVDEPGVARLNLISTAGGPTRLYIQVIYGCI